VSGLENLTSIEGGLWIESNNALTSLSGLESLTSIGGGLHISSNNALISLTGLEGLNTINGGLIIMDNDVLTSLTGLENLSSIGGNLGIYYNATLTSLSGLENLSSIGGGLGITQNITLASLAGLDNINSIGGGLGIKGNHSLTSLTGLNNLSSIGGGLFIGGSEIYYGNSSLTDISGLEDLAAGSIENLEIGYNISLSNCDVQSICDYLASPNGTIFIAGNAPGCNNQQEVQEDCDSITFIGELIPKNSFIISPNPLESNTLITFTLQINSPVTLKILDLSGREMAILVSEFQQQGEQQVTFNTAGLPAGVYFCVLKTNERIQTKKMIKL